MSLLGQEESLKFLLRFQLKVHPEVANYDTGTEGDQSFRGFPLDEIAWRSRRFTKDVSPARFIDGIFVAGALPDEEIEPRNFHEAMKEDRKKEWKVAMLDELKSHAQNGTWDSSRAACGGE